MSHALPLANGPQLLVNQVIYGTQAGHRTERLADGGYVVVWVNYDGQGAGQLPADSNAAAEIRMRLFNADGSARGPEIEVNDATLGWQLDPQVAVLANGRIAVTWTDGGDFYGGAEHLGSRGVGGAGGDAHGKAVKLQLFSAAGAPMGGEQLVNTTVAQSQQAAKVAALGDGSFLVAWEDWSLSVNSQGAGGGPGIKAQLFSADGARIGSEQAWTGDWCFAPQPLALAGGGYAAIWLDAYYYDPAMIVVRMHDAHGGALGSEVALGIGGQGAGAQWSAVALSDGGLALAWTHRQDVGGDGAGSGIRARIVNADGSPRGEAFTVNGVTVADQEDVRLAALADGGFVAAWESFTPPNESGIWTRQIHARVFAPDGTAMGADRVVEANDAALALNALTALGDGGFVVGWTGRSWIDVHMRAYGADGEPLAETAVVHGGGGFQDAASVTLLDSGRFAFTWHVSSDGYSGGDGHVDGLQTRVFATSGARVAGTADTDRLAGTPYGDRLEGGAGNDLLLGYGGGDTVDGGSGVDTFVLDVDTADVLARAAGLQYAPGRIDAFASSLGNVTLEGVERVRLQDGLYAFDTLQATDVSDGGKVWQAAALYRAAFGTLPDRTNLSYWVRQADDSTDMAALASRMIDHYLPAGVSNADLVAHLYARLTGQVASSADVQFYADQVGVGRQWESQGHLAAWAASQALNADAMVDDFGVALTGSIQPLEAGLWFG